MPTYFSCFVSSHKHYGQAVPLHGYQVLNFFASASLISGAVSLYLSNRNDVSKKQKRTRGRQHKLVVVEYDTRRRAKLVVVEYDTRRRTLAWSFIPPAFGVGSTTVTSISAVSGGGSWHTTRTRCAIQKGRLSNQRAGSGRRRQSS